MIRTRSPSKRAAADPRLKPHGHWDRREFGSNSVISERKNIIIIIIIIIIIMNITTENNWNQTVTNVVAIVAVVISGSLTTVWLAAWWRVMFEKLIVFTLVTKFPKLLNLKFCYCVYKNRTLAPVDIQFSPIYILTKYNLDPILILFPHLCLSLSRCLFPSDLRIKFCKHFLSSCCKVYILFFFVCLIWSA